MVDESVLKFRMEIFALRNRLAYMEGQNRHLIRMLECAGVGNNVDRTV